MHASFLSDWLELFGLVAGLLKNVWQLDRCLIGAQPSIRGLIFVAMGYVVG